MNLSWSICFAIYLLTMLLLAIHSATSVVGTVPLFGSVRVTLVYVCASLPLCWMLVNRVSAWMSSRAILTSAFLGCLIALAVPAISHFLDLHSAGYTQRNVMRSAISLAFTLPLVSMFILVRASKPATMAPLATVNVLLAFVCAVLLPTLYVEIQMKNLRDAWLAQEGGGRIISQLKVATCAWELHGEGMLKDRRLIAHIRDLKRQLQSIQRDLQSTLPPNASPQHYQQRVMQLLSIDRAAEANQLLSRLAPCAEVWLLRALCAREVQRWESVERATRAVLDSASADRLAMELLGESLHHQRRYDEAIAVYRPLLDNNQSPADAAIHVRMAKAFMDKGDRTMALQHLEAAKRLDDTIQVITHERSILQNSCSLRR